MTLLQTAIFLLVIVFSNAIATPVVFTSETPPETNSETNALKDLLLEIEAINPVIEEARRRQDHQDRFQFNYRCLIADFNLIKQGLRIAIYKQTTPSTHPSKKLCRQYGYVGQQGEAESLQLLIYELQTLTDIIHDAKSTVNLSDKIQFNYPVLESDIDHIITAIEFALLGSGNHPRSFPALRGGFSQ